jgi:hypothetical protein
MREEFERVQTQLYEDIVAPHEGELLRFLETVRELVDEIMMDVQARVWYKNPNVVKKDLFNGDVPTIFQYPNGNCYLIVATALEVLEDFIPDEAPYLREFQKR